MTQRGEEGVGEPSASGTTASVSDADSSPWAPFGQRAFRWLWLGVFISYIGTWMQTVGAQWLLVDSPNAAALVSLVQVANTLPVMLLALPGGVLADSFDRRWLLFTVQAYFFVVGILLAALTFAGQMPPALLLAFTFAIAIGAAVQLPAWQATIPELVPRTQLRAATRLEMVGVNVARAGGPALAGLVIARFGVPWVFALNALSVIFLAIALLFWRRPSTGSEATRERFVPALRAGGRYVWHEPVVRRILLRTALFITPGIALGLAPPDRHSALGPRSRRLRRSVRCAGTRRHHRRPDTGAGEGPVNQWDAQCGRRPLRGTGRDRPGPQFPGGPSDIGFRWTGLDHSHLDAERRTAAFPAGLGPRSGPRRLHGQLHRFDDGWSAGLGTGRRGRRSDHSSSRPS